LDASRYVSPSRLVQRDHFVFLVLFGDLPHFFLLFQALELVHGGYANIDQVLTGVKNGDVELDRNQLVGVECYEDLLDKMGPEEIETIGVNVRDTVKGLFPSAEVTITGSRRRGKESCGDVVMHVACPEYQEEVPEKELAKIVDALWRKGRISFHLTFLPWMETGIESEADHKSSRYVPKEAWWEATRNEKVREGHSSSYMGIFNSPTEKNKRRRVDIKFYPYRERIFASLYFTGNGHFNRSMRLWAARQFDFTLNDHGLFQRGGTQDRVMMEASREKDVFTKLGLKYVEPEDRDCFDAVVPKAGGIQAAVDLEMSEDEFREDNEQHVWID
jgi:DNA polymerase lambda